MKKVVFIIFSVVVFIAILINTVFFMTSGITETAESFFAAVKAEDFTKAYTYLSEGFKANTPQDRLIQYLSKSALVNFKETSWSSRSISGRKGEIDGSLMTETGGVVPVKLGFIKENDSWKIYSIQKQKAGLSQEITPKEYPSVDALMKLTDESMLKFANSVNAKNFTEFHDHVSHLWQKQYSVEQLNEAFKSFIEGEIDMVSALKSHNPKFDAEPAIDDDGVLLLAGHYPTEPSNIQFQLKYIYEGVDWKLVGLAVTIE